MARHSVNAAIPKPQAPPADDPQLWTNHAAMLYARKKGWNYRDRKALYAKALEMGLAVKPHTVPAALIRSIAANLQAHGGL